MSVGEGDAHPYNMSAAMPEPKTQESVFQHTHVMHSPHILAAGQIQSISDNIVGQTGLSWNTVDIKTHATLRCFPICENAVRVAQRAGSKLAEDACMQTCNTQPSRQGPIVADR